MSNDGPLILPQPLKAQNIPPDVRCCKNCKFSESNRMPGSLQKQLTCKRFPPQLIAGPMQQGMQQGWGVLGCMQPVVAPEMFCHEFVSIEVG